MEPLKYHTRPGPVTAMQWTGDNLADLSTWTGGLFDTFPDVEGDPTAALWSERDVELQAVPVGDWVVRDVDGFVRVAAIDFDHDFVPANPPDFPDPDADHVLEFRTWWADLVTRHDGSLDPDKVARELFGLHAVMSEVSTVYDELTGGKFSKPSTAATYIVSAVEKRTNAWLAFDLIRDLLPQITGKANRQKVIDYAENLYPGAQREEAKYAAAIERVRAGQATDEGADVAEVTTQ